MLSALIYIIQSIAISLGVGSSTLAVTNFFVAIWDGNMDASERKMMGVVYVFLRISMVLILLTTIYFTFLSSPSAPLIATPIIWTLIAILYLNAILMTKHIMPATFGPAIQASAWYSTGLLTSFLALGWSISYLQFGVLYLVLFGVLLVSINGLLKYNIRRQQPAE